MAGSPKKLRDAWTGLLETVGLSMGLPKNLSYFDHLKRIGT